MVGKDLLNAFAQTARGPCHCDLALDQRFKISAFENRARQDCALNVGPHQIDTIKVGAAQIRSLQSCVPRGVSPDSNISACYNMLANFD